MVIAQGGDTVDFNFGSKNVKETAEQELSDSYKLYASK